jgi:hypothetical protein
MPDVKTLNISGVTPITFDVTAPFVAVGTGAVSTTCASIMRNAQSSTLGPFLDTYNIGSASSATTNPLKNKLDSFKTVLPITDVSREVTGDIAAVNNYLTNLQNTHIPILRHVDNCLRESLQIDTTNINKAQNNLDESKSRLASITNPEENVSYYEGWFPIVRPMTESALFGLFGSSILLLLISIMIMLRLTGLQIDIRMPEVMLPPFLSFLTLPPNASSYIYGGIAVGLIGSIIYAYYIR